MVYEQFGYLCFMRLLSALFAFYIQASFHVAGSLISLLVLTEQWYGMAMPMPYYGVVFFGSLAGYNAIKYGAEPWKRRKERGTPDRAIFWLSLVSALLALALLTRLEFHYWVLLGFTALLAALYALPVLPGFRNLRSFGLFKVPLVALVWTLVSLWIPYGEAGVLKEWDLLVEGFQRLLWVGLLMLPFEVRDMPVDPPALRTLPRRLGLNGTRILGWTGALVFVLSGLLKEHPEGGEFLAKAFAGLLTGLGVHCAREEQSPYYASFWIEAIPMAVLAWHTAWIALAG